MVLHAALKTDVGVALGVELSSLRHAIAEAALDELQLRGRSFVAAVAAFFVCGGRRVLISTAGRHRVTPR